MAARETCCFALKLAVLFLTINFLNNGVLHGISVTGFEVEPLWSDNDSYYCSVHYSNESGGSIYRVEGSPHLACHLSVSSSPGYDVRAYLFKYKVWIMPIHMTCFICMLSGLAIWLCARTSMWYWTNWIKHVIWLWCTVLFCLVCKDMQRLWSPRRKIHRSIVQNCR